MSRSRRLNMEHVRWKRIQSSMFQAPNFESGVILIGALITMAFFMVVTLSIIEFSVNHYAATRRSLVSLNALSAAEAGADYFLQQINKGASYTGTSGEFTFYSDNIRGKATYQTSIVDGAIDREKIITSTGRIYLPATAASPLVTRKIKVIITQTNAPAPYSIETGPGGLVLNNQVHIATGPIFVGGKLSLNNNATIGSAAVPIRVNVQDLACPTTGGSTYPVLCAAPYSVSLANGTAINGDVYATNGIDNPSFATNRGLVSNVVPTIAYPVIDHAAVTTAHGWTTNGNQNITCSGGTATIAADTHFTNGNGISVPNNCIVKVNGDIWIDRTISFGNNAALSVANSLNSQPLFIIDGYSTAGGSFITGNGNSLNANSAGFGFEILAYASFGASGDGFNSCSPGCASVTGSELYNSQNHNTIILSNNFVSAAGTTFYARWTGISIINNTTVAQLIGQKLSLGNNGTLAFAGPVVVEGGDTGWNVKYWEQIFQ